MSIKQKQKTIFVSIQTQTTKRPSIPVTKVSIKQKQKMISHNKGTTLQCNQCDYKAVTQSNLKEHIVATYNTIKPDKTYTVEWGESDQFFSHFIDPFSILHFSKTVI